MAKPGKHALALAAVIQCVLSESPRKRVARGCGGGRNAEVGPEALTVTRGALLPFRWRIACLIDASGECGADDGIGPKRIEEIVAKPRFLIGTRVRHSHLRE